MPPRVTLLACGTLALTIYCWTATIADSAPQPLGTLIHTAWLGGAVALLLLAVLAANLQTEGPCRHTCLLPAYLANSPGSSGLTAALSIAM